MSLNRKIKKNSLLTQKEDFVFIKIGGIRFAYQKKPLKKGSTASAHIAYKINLAPDKHSGTVLDDKVYVVKQFRTGSDHYRHSTQEAAILQRLKKSVFLKNEDKKSYLAIDYIEGTQLNTQANINIVKKFKWDEKIKLADLIANELKKIHDAKIVHGDFTPFNILFNLKIKPQTRFLPKQFSVHIIDFGNSRELKTADEVIILPEKAGTEKYMSPEAHNKHLGMAGDIYSLGIILSEQLFYNMDEFPDPTVRHYIPLFLKKMVDPDILIRPKSENIVLFFDILMHLIKESNPHEKLHLKERLKGLVDTEIVTATPSPISAESPSSDILSTPLAVTSPTPTATEKMIIIIEHEPEPKKEEEFTKEDRDDKSKTQILSVQKNSKDEIKSSSPASSPRKLKTGDTSKSRTRRLSIDTHGSINIPDSISKSQGTNESQAEVLDGLSAAQLHSRRSDLLKESIAQLNSIIELSQSGLHTDPSLTDHSFDSNDPYLKFHSLLHILTINILKVQILHQKLQIFEQTTDLKEATIHREEKNGSLIISFRDENNKVKIYRINKSSKPLGTGGFGVVYHAEHLRYNKTKGFSVRKGKKFVAKLVRKHKYNQKEADVNKLLNIQTENPILLNIPGETEPTVLLIMENLGEPLNKKKVKELKKELPIVKRIEIICHIIRYVNLLHSLGIIHCDLKDINILYRKTEDGTPIGIPIDFGSIEYSVKQKKSVHSTVTSRLYTPIETATRNIRYRHSDWYSLGPLFAELLGVDNAYINKEDFYNQLKKCIGINTLIKLLDELKSIYFQNELTIDNPSGKIEKLKNILSLVKLEFQELNIIWNSNYTTQFEQLEQYISFTDAEDHVKAYNLIHDLTNEFSLYHISTYNGWCFPYDFTKICEEDTVSRSIKPYVELFEKRMVNDEDPTKRPKDEEVETFFNKMKELYHAIEQKDHVAEHTIRVTLALIANDLWTMPYKTNVTRQSLPSASVKSTMSRMSEKLTSLKDPVSHLRTHLGSSTEEIDSTSANHLINHLKNIYAKLASPLIEETPKGIEYKDTLKIVTTEKKNQNTKKVSESEIFEKDNPALQALAKIEKAGCFIAVKKRPLFKVLVNEILQGNTVLINEINKEEMEISALSEKTLALLLTAKDRALTKKDELFELPQRTEPKWNLKLFSPKPAVKTESLIKTKVESAESEKEKEEVPLTILSHTPR